MARKKKPRFFVTDAPVAVWEFSPEDTIADREPNVIYIRARMDVETAGRVGDELVRLDPDGKAELHAGANQTALLIHNVVRWEGPDFEMLDEADQPMRDAQNKPIYVPCTPENIRQLDHRDPFIERVIDEIGERNQKRTSPKARAAATTNGSTTDIGPDYDHEPSVSLQLASGGLKSSSLIDAVGRRIRSDDSTPTT